MPRVPSLPSAMLNSPSRRLASLSSTCLILDVSTEGFLANFQLCEKINHVIGATAETHVSSSRHKVHSQCRCSLPPPHQLGQGSPLVSTLRFHHTFRGARSVHARARGAPAGSSIRHALCLPRWLSACQMLYCCDPYQKVPSGSRPIQLATRKRRKIAQAKLILPNMALMWPLRAPRWPEVDQKRPERRPQRVQEAPERPPHPVSSLS